jgi:hypothetical protein
LKLQRYGEGSEFLPVRNDRKKCTEDWSNPVNPVVAWEVAIDDSRSKGAGRVHARCSKFSVSNACALMGMSKECSGRTSCKSCASQMGDEQSKANADRCDESGAVLLSCEHEDGEDQQCRHEHLDEQTTSGVCVCG